jgi:hypothetical protein
VSLTGCAVGWPVKQDQFFSKWQPIHTGIPQGTQFGSLGFIVLVNDMLADLKYVDDSTFVETIFKPADSSMNLKETST